MERTKDGLLPSGVTKVQRGSYGDLVSGLQGDYDRRYAFRDALLEHEGEDKKTARKRLGFIAKREAKKAEARRLEALGLKRPGVNKPKPVEPEVIERYEPQPVDHHSGHRVMGRPKPHGPRPKGYVATGRYTGKKVE